MPFLIHSEPDEEDNSAYDPSRELDPFWGRDLVIRGGVLDAVYFQLGLSPFKWPGLKALPTVAPTSDSAAFRGAVRSLISVLDAELAASLPAPSPGQKRPGSPKAGRLTTPDELWDGLLESSDEESEQKGKEEDDEDEELKKDKLWERHLEEEQRRREQHHHKNASLSAGGSFNGESPMARQAKQVLKELKEIATSPKRAEGRGSPRRECAALVKQLEEHLNFENGDLTEAAETEIDRSISCGTAAPEMDNKESSKTLETSIGASNQSRKKAKDISRKRSGFTGQVSPIAIAALWELLQCCIGASVAAGEAAKAAAEDDTDQGGSILRSSSPKFLKRQGPPPCVRWYDARARVALGLVSMWLQVPLRKLATLEVLLGSDKAPTTVRLRELNSASDRYRYLKVGLAALGGGALFAVTGGLAAPAIAAGVGSLLGIVPGAGAAAGAVAGFMSTQVGVAAVTTTMATAGAATTGSKMAYRTADVSDFGFVELRETMAPAALTNSTKSPARQHSLSSQQGRRTSSGHLESYTSTGAGEHEDASRGQSPLLGDPGHLTLGGIASSSLNTTGSFQGSGRAHGSAGSLRGASYTSPHSNSAASLSGGGAGNGACSSTGLGINSNSTGAEEGSSSSTTPAWKSWFGKKGGTEEESSTSNTSTNNNSTANALLPSPVRPSHPAEGIKLSTVIGISGWISSPEDFTNPWNCLKAPASDKFALVWCTSELQALNRALGALLAKGAAGQAASLGMQHLLVGAAGLVTALGPTVILGAAAGLLIENAWTVAIDRADKAGKLLAHVLMGGGGGGRPVTLVAHSMGARLVFAALLELCRCGARGLVQDVVLLGAPIPPAAERWRMARRVVAGRLVNGYSRRDWLLSVMFWQGIAKSAAGLAPVEVDGIENVSLTSVVGGHFDYIGGLEEILELLQLTSE